MCAQVTPPTILIVEDEKAVSNILQEKLVSEGFNILTALDGADGLATALEKHPDIILLDIVMPVMDGITFLKKLRHDQWGAKAKVIVLSNLDDEKKVAEALESGAHHYLVKTDWKIDDLVAKVRAVLKK